MATIQMYQSLWNELSNIWLDRTSPKIEQDLQKINEVAKMLGLGEINKAESDFTITKMGDKIPTIELLNKMEKKRTACKGAILKKIEKLEPLFR